MNEYLGSLRVELEQRLAVSRLEAPLETVYIGGGTPSLLGPGGVARLISLIREISSLVPDAEITLEANPDDISQDAAEQWLAAGVNRLSIGLQSFDDAVLRWMHRVHNAVQGEQAVRVAREAGFSNISVDLIFALPAELNRSWGEDLTRALDLEPSHISLYGLTIEPSTPLGRWHARGSVRAADEEIYAEEFLLADVMTSARGFRHYEVSNFALPGMESRHNSAYWSGAAYLGVGPSAHSFDGTARSWNVRAYAEWTRRLAGGGDVVEATELLTSDNVSAERVYLGLRTDRGLMTSGRELEKARQWSEAGWARIDRQTVRLTPEGWLRLDSLAAGLTAL